MSEEEIEVATTDEDKQEEREEATQKIPEGLNSEQDIILRLAAKLKYYTN